MITNNNAQGIVIEKLNSSEIRFFLTGSRFFGNFRSDSDWDFYTKNTTKAKRELSHLGFGVIKSNYYSKPYGDDPNVALVYEHTYTKVQVQLVNDVETKHQAQHFLNNLPGDIRQHFLRAGKQEAKVWWKWAYKMVSRTREGSYNSWEEGRRIWR
jgi:hypothetical protein